MIIDDMIGTRHLNGKITPDKHTGKDEIKSKSGNLFISQYSGRWDNDCLLTKCSTANSHSFESSFTIDQYTTTIYDDTIAFENGNILTCAI